MAEPTSKLFMRCLLYISLTSFLLEGKSIYAQSSSIILHQLQAATQDSVKIKLYIKLAEYYYTQDRSDSSIIVIKKGIHLSQTFPQYTSHFCFYWGLYYRAIGDYNKALDKLTLAQQLAIQFNQRPLIERTGYALAVVYGDKGDYDKGIRQVFTNLRIAKQFNSQVRVGTNYALISEFNSVCGNDSLAFFYHLKAFNLLTHEKGDPQLEELKKMTLIEINKKKIANALKYKQYATANTLFDLSFSKGNYFHTYRRDYYDAVIDAALQYYIYGYKDRALTILQHILALPDSKQPKFQDIIHASIYPVMTRLYLDRNELTLAEKFHKQSISLIRRYTNVKQYLMVSENEALLLEKTGHYKSAIQAFHKYQTLQDSLLTISNGFKAIQLVTIIEAEKQEHNLALANQQISIQALKIDNHKRRHVYTYIIIGLLALVVVTTAFLLKRVQTGHRLVLEKKEQIEKQAIELKDANQTKDKLFSIISHDLRSPIAELQIALKLFNQKALPDKEKTIQQLYYRVANLKDTVDNLLYWSVSQINQIKITANDLDLKDNVRECIRFLETSATRKDITILDFVDKNSIYANEQQLQIILRNVLSNAIKFTPAGGYIRISSLNDSTYSGISIQDTGIGMSEEILKEIFTTPHVQRGTTGEQGIGLGLRLCQELMAKMGAELTIVSQRQQGTTVFLKFTNRMSLSENVA